MSVTDINIAPSASVIVAMYKEAELRPDATLLIARAAVDNGLGDTAIDRLSLRLLVDGEVPA